MTSHSADATGPGRGAPRLEVTEDAVTLDWADGRRAVFDSLWLCDNQPRNRDSHSGQRLIDIVDVPSAPRIRSALIRDGELEVSWTQGTQGARFGLDWLAAQLDPAVSRPELLRRLWTDAGSQDARRDFAWLTFADWRSSDGKRLSWLVRLLQDGVAFLRDVPRTMDGILEAMQGAGQVSETNYGRVFDVRSVPQPENLAYSDLGLGLHTDNPYRDPVPGFQTLHAMLTPREGGDSLLADGLALAEQLRADDPASFEVLTRTRVPFHYRSRDADLYAERPLIQLACDGAVSAVHYNSRSIAPLPLQGDAAHRFYAAYRAFAALLREPRLQLRLRLGAGELVMFDNQRVLHGRTAYSSSREPRHLRGCYLSRDSVFGMAALLRRQLAEGLRS